MTISTILGYDDLPRLLTLLTGDEKHDRSSFSTLDVLWVLYDRVLRVDPREPDDPDRDRFLLSKGHGPAAYYAVLAAKGFVPVSSLAGFGGGDSPLGHHPDRLLVPGVEISSGSLGHGLPIAVGVALGLDVRGADGPASSASSVTRSWRRGATSRRCSSRGGSGSGDSPWSSSTTARRRKGGRAAWSGASSSRNGAQSVSTGATMRRSSRR